MSLTISRAQARELDRRAVADYGMTGAMLMENAGRGVADKLSAIGVSGTVAICCGRGNNGGDGFVVARHLDLRGYRVAVLVFDDPERFTGDAALNFHVIRAAGISIERVDPSALDARLAGAAWVVDALLGTGAAGEVRPPYDAAIDRMNAAGVPILAIDVPSGLDCDTGRAARHTIRAAHTCTFVAQKPGFLVAGAERYTGQVHIIDIGAPRRLVEGILRQT